MLLLPHDVNTEARPGRCERSKNFLLKWVGQNVIKLLSERRLTTNLKGESAGEKMIPIHPDNLKRIKKAYIHPFLKIPS